MPTNLSVKRKTSETPLGAAPAHPPRLFRTALHFTARFVQRDMEYAQQRCRFPRLAKRLPLYFLITVRSAFTAMEEWDKWDKWDKWDEWKAARLPPVRS